MTSVTTHESNVRNYELNFNTIIIVEEIVEANTDDNIQSLGADTDINRIKESVKNTIECSDSAHS